MSNENLQKPYKQRFKGVETFLRRIAFNLGNTASQTEVKIISCIPIDVTDLQQKIINLEKQLHEAQQQATAVDDNVHEKPKDKPSAVVNTALFGSNFAKQSSTISYCSNKPIGNVKSGQLATYCGDCSSRTKKSNVSFVFPAMPAPNTEHGCKFNAHNDCTENTAAIERCKNIFRKRKRKKGYKGNNKMKTHLVYYAQQTADNPFKRNERSVKYNETLSNNDELCISHLNNVMRKQYDPNEVVEEYSDTSHFPRPVCRDVENKYGYFNHYESDGCSCCHDKFQNIDNYMTKTDYNSILTKLHNTFDNTEVYYDSNNYDIIPVKENNNIKVLKNEDELKMENKMNVEMKCWPEHLRIKHRYYPFIVNYQAETLAKQRPIKKPQAIFIPEKYKPPKINRNRDKIMKSDQQTAIETSKSCCVDCSDVYPKHPRRVESRKNDILKTKFQKNESVATDTVDNKLKVNNQSTQLELSVAEVSRDLTLNQIKTILQSVLEEVKTSSKLNHADDSVKKDAIVQKGSSQNSMPGASTLLHSYTYNNSYNTNSYLASCSKQIPNGPYCLASVPYQPVRCLQNFPVFVQPTSGRHLCACYYRKSSCKPQNKVATTAGTNTEKNIEMSSSKETEKLIKEIYKSMALNMDFPTKDTSTSDYNDLKSENISSNTMDGRSKDSTKTITKVEAMVSPIQSIIRNQNNLEYASVKTRSENRRQPIDSFFNKAQSTGNMNKGKCVNRLEVHSIRSSDTIVEDEEETEGLNDESESDETVIVTEEFKQKSKPKKNFLNRMFKLFKKKKQTQEEIEASDSEDYETIYSERSAKISPRKYRENKTYTKVKKYSSNDENRDKGSPYLEQEYRRQWNESLTFREHDTKRSSERPVSRHSSSRPRRPVYWNNYEARSVIVDHKLPNQYKTIDAIKNLINRETTQRNESLPKNNNKERLGWLKKHKLGIHCGDQWKKFILEN